VSDCPNSGSFCNIFVLCAVLLALFVSCSPPEDVLRDGYYSVESAEFNEHGWKEYITVCVSGGRIILVEYDAFNRAGFIRSWDMNYKRRMNAGSGTYPSAFARYYGEKFLEKQGTRDIDVLSGATRSYHSFKQLAQAILENARHGDADTMIITLDIPGSQ